MVLDFLLGFGICAVVLLSLPSLMVFASMTGKDPQRIRSAWNDGQAFVLVWAAGWVCICLWALLVVVL